MAFGVESEVFYAAIASLGTIAAVYISLGRLYASESYRQLKDNSVLFHIGSLIIVDFLNFLFLGINIFIVTIFLYLIFKGIIGGGALDVNIIGGIHFFIFFGLALISQSLYNQATDRISYYNHLMRNLKDKSLQYNYYTIVAGFTIGVIFSLLIIALSINNNTSVDPTSKLSSIILLVAFLIFSIPIILRYPIITGMMEKKPFVRIQLNDKKNHFEKGFLIRWEGDFIRIIKAKHISSLLPIRAITKIENLSTPKNSNKKFELLEHQGYEITKSGRSTIVAKPTYWGLFKYNLTSKTDLSKVDCAKILVSVPYFGLGILSGISWIITKKLKEREVKDILK
ncbi:MAG: hypothetical protein AABY04_01400 [Candidatus Micrarchaeota archaeon]